MEQISVFFLVLWFSFRFFSPHVISGGCLILWRVRLVGFMCSYCSCGVSMEMRHSKCPEEVKGGSGQIHNRLAKYILAAEHFEGAWPDSVAVGLMRVLWRLLGGRGVSHAALGQWCAWSWVLVGSMWIGALEHRRYGFSIFKTRGL